MHAVSNVMCRWRPWALAVACLFNAHAAHAGLFSDDEARRAILEVRAQRAKDVEAANAKIAELTTQVDALRRSVLDMNAQIEQMRAELAHRRGQEEVLLRDLSEVQRRQADLQGNFDERVRKLEPQDVTFDGKTFKADAEEKRLFDEALGRMRGGDFAAGATGLNTLLQRYPETGYRESAWYWLGNAHYGQRKYKEAITVFRQVADKAPEHLRAPEALLSVANCYTELKDNANARKALESLVKQYPQTEAAQVARDRLLTMPKAAATSSKKR